MSDKQEVLDVKTKLLEEYWSKRFLSEISKNNLLIGRENEIINKDFCYFKESISPNTFASLKKASKNSDLGLFILLFSGVNVFIYKYLKTQEVNLITTSSTGSLILCQNKIDSASSLKEFISTAKKNVIEDFNHSEFCLESVLNLIHTKLDQSFSQDDFLAFHYNKFYNRDNDKGNNDLSIIANNSEEGLEFEIKYDSNIYSSTFIEHFGSNMLFFFDNFIKSLNVEISELEIVSKYEREILVNELNNSSALNTNDSIADIFDNQVKINKDKVALISNDLQLTYGELGRKTDQLAYFLRREGVSNNHVVGLMIEKSIETIIGILGIIKAGGAYLPIDTKLPKTRKDYLLQDSNATLLLTCTKDDCALDSDIKKVNIDNKKIYEKLIGIEPINKITDLAYIIYTSGTTGNPKGVLINNKNVVSLLFHQDIQFNFTTHDVWTMFHSYYFDFSVWEIFGSLLYGGKLIIISDRFIRDPNSILNIIQKNQVTVLNQTPTAFYNLSDAELKIGSVSTNLKYVIFGGEALNPIKLKRWKIRYPQTTFINMYGITETTVHVTYKEINQVDIESGLSNIGKAIPSLEIYIMDEEMNLQPFGMEGEILVGGEGVSHGYMNRVELTAEKFVKSSLGEGFLYKSGDMARWLIDKKELSYLGRIDNQIQLKGFRIEPKEIQSKLLLHDLIEDVVVIDEVDKYDNKYLIAYYIGKNKNIKSDFKKYLSGLLPEYLIPSYFYQINAFPLTSNSKLDKDALKTLKSNSKKNLEFEGSKLEKKMHKIWKEQLQVDEIGQQDSYFALGGDSIRAISLINSVNSEFNVQISIPELYENDTINKFVSLLSQKDKSDLKIVEETKEYLEKVKNEYLSILSPDNINVDDVYPMSDIETGMVFYSLKHSKTGIYHDQIINQIYIEDFNLGQFEKALLLLVEKHRNLRASFELETIDIPVKVINKNIQLSLKYVDISDKERTSQEIYIEDYQKKDRQSKFDYNKSPLWRIKLFGTGNNMHVLLFTFHHSILDGWSVASFLTELNNLYFKLNSNSEYVSDKLQSSYKDYIIQQLISKKDLEIRDFWKNELLGYKKLSIFNGKNLVEEEIETFTQNIDPELFLHIKELATNINSSPKHIFFSSYIYMLNMLSYDDDIMVGYVSHNRPIEEDSDKILGCFLNTVPFRLKIPLNITFIDFIKIVDQKLKLLKHYDGLTLNEINSIAGENVQDENPFFDTLFNYIDFHIYKNIIINEPKDDNVNKNDNYLPLKSYENTNTLFNVKIGASATAPKFYISYKKGLFSKELISKISTYYFTFLNKVVNTPDDILSKEKLLSEQEHENLLFSLNNTDGRSGFQDKSISELFENQSERCKDHIAVIYKSTCLSFKELNSKANQLARILRNAGVKNNDVVAVCLERSVEMIISILGIIKAGAAYLPIDVEFPEKRKIYMLNECSTQLIITDKNITSNHPINNHLNKLFVEDIFLSEIDNSNLNIVNSMQDLIYVIFTSGTTGKPKGVMITHENVNNLIFGLSKEIYNKYDTLNIKIGIVSPFIFDASVKQIFASFVLGKTLVVIGEDERREGIGLVNLLLREQLDVIDGTPMHLRLIIESTNGRELNQLVKNFIIGGEILHKSIVRDLFKQFSNKSLVVSNVYGPTECAVDTTLFNITNKNIDDYDRIPIGKPLINYRIYILDNNRMLLPEGSVGFIYVSGKGVSKGYINRNKLTNEMFVDNSFGKEGKLYNTGDLGRWLPCGNIEYIGRNDNQIKVRGVRIELEEIENALNNYPSISRACVVLKRQQKGRDLLYSFYVAENKIEIDGIKELLKSEFPSNYLPDRYIQVESFPFKTSGKINKDKLLKTYSEEGSHVETSASEDLLTQQIIDIWAEVLDVNKNEIFNESNFFELGGHSLSAIRIVLLLQKRLGVEVPMTLIFKSPELYNLVNFIRTNINTRAIEIKVAEEKEFYYLSSAQKRMYFTQKLNLESTALVIPYAFLIRGGLDLKRFELSFNKVIQKHEGLRTSFHEFDGSIIQKIHKNEDFKIEVKNLPENLIKLDGENEKLEKFLFNSIQPIELNNRHLLKVIVFKGRNLDNILLICIHHIISDETSNGILINDLLTAYETGSFKPNQLQYKDYSEFENKLSTKKRIKNQKEYWVKKLNGMVKLKLPYDYHQNVKKSFTGNKINLILEQNTIDKIKELATKFNVTLNVMFLTFYNILLSKICDQKDITIGTITEGRRTEELLKIIGFFVNTILIRNNIENELSFSDTLLNVNNTFLEAYENQDYQFDDLVKDLNIKREEGQNSIFNTMFTFKSTNNLTKKEKESSLKVETLQTFDNKASFDLMLLVLESKQDIQLVFEFSNESFKEEKIKLFANYYLSIIDQVILLPNIQLNKIILKNDLLTASIDSEFDSEWNI